MEDTARDQAAATAEVKAEAAEAAAAKAGAEAAEKTRKQERRKLFYFDPKEDIITLVLIVAASFVQALAINGFYVPHQFLSGGVTGVSLLLKYLVDIPMWIPIVILNIPISLVGLKYLKPKMVIFSGFAFGVFAIAAALTENVDFGVQNPILSALAGAAIIGVTSAPVVRRDATMGGTDILAAILSRRYSIPMGTFSIFFNFVIMSVLAVFRGLELGLASMLAMFACNMAFNAALKGLNRTVTVFIISDKWDEIAPLVMEKLHRGATYIPAEGAYTGAPKKLVYCIVRTAQLSQLKRIVVENDDHALFSMIETKEVIGRGFGSLN